MLWFTEWRESVCVILIWVLPFMDFFYDDDNLRALFHGDVFFCGDDLMIIVIYDEKRLFSRWVGVCRCFRKTGDIHNMAETIFLRYIFTFHFYMLHTKFFLPYSVKFYRNLNSRALGTQLSKIIFWRALGKIYSVKSRKDLPWPR